MTLGMRGHGASGMPGGDTMLLTVDNVVAITPGCDRIVGFISKLKVLSFSLDHH